MRSFTTRTLWTGVLAAAALLTLAKGSTANTLDLAAMATPALCSVAEASSFLAMEPQTPAPNTPDDRQPKSCRVNGNCWKPAYCAKEEGTCKGSGVCKVKPESCPDMTAPVCGCNDKTYGNECLAAAAGTNVSHKGECQKKDR